MAVGGKALSFHKPKSELKCSGENMNEPASKIMQGEKGSRPAYAQLITKSLINEALVGWNLAQKAAEILLGMLY